jgi:beta-N-acetylhexosaminidase
VAVKLKIKKCIYIFIPVLIISLLLGCSIGLSQNTKVQNDPIVAQIKKMTLDEKIGQMVLMGFDGYTVNFNTAELIKKYKIGGFIFYASNIRDSKQTSALLNALKTKNKVNKIPLFLSVDEEGGRVSRLPKEILKFPTNKKIGEINNPNFSYSIGTILGKELKAFGFNLDFAPVMDINSNPNNPVIGDRSFGATEPVVSSLGVQTMKGIQSQKVISVIKHFPGHGDTSVDSHLGLPKVNKTLASIKAFELLPFQNAINANADMVMVAHILFPKIDPKYPSSFSKTIISGILRDYLRYSGVVITDDLEMGAIAKNYSIESAAVKSIQAGGDICLVGHTFSVGVNVINALKKAVQNKEITISRIDDSVYRILRLKQKYGLADKTVGPVNVGALNKEISGVLSKY